MSYMTVGATDNRAPAEGTVAPGTGGYTLLGKSNCVNTATGSHVATTKCAGQPISTLPPVLTAGSGGSVAVVQPMAPSGPPKILLIGGALAVAGVGYWLWKKRKGTP